MSVEAMAIVLHHSRAKGAAKLILLGIANHAGDGGSWPTVATLAKYANITERAVQLALRKLQQSGELWIDQQGGGLAHMKDHQRPNRYELKVACPIHCDRTTNHRVRRPVDNSRQLSLVPTSDPVKPASPGEASFTPPGEASFTRTVPTNPPTTDSRKVTTTRARDCAICSRPEPVCRKVTSRSHDHAFEAKA